MNKTLIWILIVVFAAALGIGMAFLIRSSSGMNFSTQSSNLYQGYSSACDEGFTRGPGNMMGSFTGSNQRMQGESCEFPFEPELSSNSDERITIDQAYDAAEEYIKTYYSNELEIDEIMEFELNFYVLVEESDTGKGAFELLVDPYSANVSPEPGPNMMWNDKYGHMRSGSGENSITLEEAREIGQRMLDDNYSDAEIEGSGYQFYGYYTFDFEVDGTMEGMFSVHGTTGQIFYHSWHGEFIQEKEY